MRARRILGFLLFLPLISCGGGVDAMMDGFPLGGSLASCQRRLLEWRYNFTQASRDAGEGGESMRWITADGGPRGKPSRLGLVFENGRLVLAQAFYHDPAPVLDRLKTLGEPASASRGVRRWKPGGDVEVEWDEARGRLIVHKSHVNWRLWANPSGGTMN
ncbi:MAG: hypothetical protein GMKNLPBB_01066 [Myxococcota bacterium]|nr:hypothetical protein [Myxococcota bacterium]